MIRYPTTNLSAHWLPPRPLGMTSSIQPCFSSPAFTRQNMTPHQANEDKKNCSITWRQILVPSLQRLGSHPLGLWYISQTGILSVIVYMFSKNLKTHEKKNPPSTPKAEKLPSSPPELALASPKVAELPRCRAIFGWWTLVDQSPGKRRVDD